GGGVCVGRCAVSALRGHPVRPGEVLQRAVVELKPEWEPWGPFLASKLKFPVTTYQRKYSVASGSKDARRPFWRRRRLRRATGPFNFLYDSSFRDSAIRTPTMLGLTPWLRVRFLNAQWSFVSSNVSSLPHMISILFLAAIAVLSAFCFLSILSHTGTEPWRKECVGVGRV
ncbi:hypothetical protein DQ04_08411000, partial [Trypanosoma grayi]|uniref:hypothetical protein n=1 Tax=Trypanosoma grayi TaxID=71804 RepID=UPI0004F4AF4B